MRPFGLRRVKTLFLTAFSFAFCFILLLNVMVHQLNISSETTDTERLKYSVNQKKLRQLMGPGIQKPDTSYIESGRLVWPERQPKAANEKTLNYDSHQKANSSGKKSVVYNENTTTVRPKHFNDVKKSFVKNGGAISEKDGIVNNYKDTTAVAKDGSQEEDYVYEKDINKVVIKDDDVDDDADNDDYYYDGNKDGNKNDLKSLGLKNVSNHENSESEDKYDQEENNGSMEASQGVSVLVFHGNSSQTQIKHIVQDGIYWSAEAERFVPKGMSIDEVVRWIDVVRHEKIKMLQPPSWDRCGRPKNGFVVMRNGIELCARYRHPHDKLVLGEVMSFYLSLLLKMDNVPAVLLTQVNKTCTKWEGTEPNKLGWEELQYVALIQWINHIESKHSHVQMPPIMLEIYNTGNMLVGDTVNQHKLQSTDISNIIQWGSMIIFDYLTGNYDRVASMQDAAEKEKSPTIIQDDIRNLRKSTKSGKLWLIDNESGLLDAYDLLYRSIHTGEQFVHFHQQMLRTMCVFQRNLVDALKDLHNSINPHHVLEEYVRKYEPHFDSVPKDNSYALFQTMFSKRLSDVVEWIQYCEAHAKR